MVFFMALGLFFFKLMACGRESSKSASFASVVSHKRLELFFAIFGRFDRAAVEPGLICSKV
jgi:hypothetical protein